MSLHTLRNTKTGHTHRLTLEEICGLVILTLGLVCFLNLLLTDDVALSTILMGWTAPYFGLTCLLAGFTILLGHHFPSWRLEAVLGAQLLLIALMTGSYIWQQSEIDWQVVLDGSYGGIFGRALGNMLLGGVGRLAAGILVHLAALGGTWLFVRYTPLIYIPLYVMACVLRGVGTWQRWQQTASLSGPSETQTAARPRSPKVAASRHAGQTAHSAGTRSEKAQRPVLPRTSSLATVATTQPVVMETGDGQASTAPDFVPKQSGTDPRPALAVSGSQVQDTGPQRKARAKLRPMPGLDLLSRHVEHGLEQGAQERADEIERIYAEYQQPVKVISIEIRPDVFRFGVKPLQVKRGNSLRPVRVKDVLALRNDVAMGLEAESIRYQAPVPGSPFVGIEIPCATRQVVNLPSVLSSWEFTAHPGHLKIGMGKEDSGKAVVADLVSVPHMLVCGATGTCKSTFLNAFLLSLLMQHGPDTLNLILVDPKQVELTAFEGLPHLVDRVATDLTVVPTLLLWLRLQMEARCEAFQKAGVRNILGFNQMASLHKEYAPLPYMVLVINELADLMMMGDSAIEANLCQLAQKCRGTGIHIVLATQRPGVDVITDTIKAHFPTRVAFALSSQMDSRVVLDGSGAENLQGKGDMLFRNKDRGKMLRVQGCWVDDQDILNVVSHWRQMHQTTLEAERPAPWHELLDTD